MFQDGEGIYLMVSPTETEAKLYRGCYVLRISDIENALIARVDSRPEDILFLGEAQGSFNGACTYSQGITIGIIYGQVFPGTPPEFRIFASGREP